MNELLDKFSADIKEHPANWLVLALGVAGGILVAQTVAEFYGHWLVNTLLPHLKEAAE